MVGILYFPKSFVPKEGAAYVLGEVAGGLVLGIEPLDQGLSKSDESNGVGEVLRQQVWRKTTSPETRTVRFRSAFPEDNGWMVYGPSHHALPVGAPDHRWVEIKAGRVVPLEAPMDARGLAVDQLLRDHPVWPNQRGDLYTLPSLQTPWREHYHRYHQFIVDSTKNQMSQADLKQAIRQDPIFQQISYGALDPQFCDYLVAMAEAGALQAERPRTAAEVAAQETLTREIIKKLLFGEPTQDRTPADLHNAAPGTDTPPSAGRRRGRQPS